MVSYAGIVLVALLAQTPSHGVSATGWSITLGALPAGSVRASSVRLRATIKNSSGSDAYVVANALGPQRTYRVSVVDTRTGRHLPTSTCVADVYNTANYTIFVANGESINIEWQLACFVRIDHAGTYRISAVDLSLSNEEQVDQISTVRVQSNVLQVRLEP